jgi:hypothetical protein
MIIIKSIDVGYIKGVVSENWFGAVFKLFVTEYVLRPQDRTRAALAFYREGEVGILD